VEPRPRVTDDVEPKPRVSDDVEHPSLLHHPWLEVRA
jgi:hypothetical protein